MLSRCKGRELKARGWVWRALGEVFILLPDGDGGATPWAALHTRDGLREPQSKLGNVIWGVETGSDLLHALIVFIL